MPAYLISNVVVRDKDAFENYRSRAAKSIAAHGGRYLVRGGLIDILEGGDAPEAVIIVEFPDIAVAQTWYASDEYAEALKFRDQALSRTLVLVDGVLP